MGLFENFPYTNFHDLNLDWLIQEVKKCYSPDNPPDAVVLSVNGESGAVVLYKEASVHFPDVESNTWNIFRVADNSAEGIEFKKNTPAKRINGLNRYAIYDQGNPPPYPVTSVDGNTGAVTTWGNTANVDVMLPHESETDKWALLRDNPSGPLGIQFEVDEDSDEPTGYFILKPEGEEIQKIKILTASDIPSEAGVITVNGSAGIVVLYAGDIKMSANDNTTVKNAIEGAENLTVADYSTVTQYSVGDFCRYLGVMYVCTGSTIGAFNPAKWSTTSASAEIKSIKSHQATDESNISTLQGQMTTANTKIGQNQAIVAYPENGSTASTNYTVGQYIARNGSLYKVVANISAGDQFTGSNLSAVDNLGHEVSALNSNFVNIHWSATTTLALSNCSEYQGIGVRYCIVGNICHLFIDVQGLTANSRVKIAKLPSNACPLMSYPMVGAGGLSYTSKSYFTISSDGNIFVISEDQYAQLYTNFIIS